MFNKGTRRNKSKRVIYVNSKLSTHTVRSRITVSRDLENYFRCLDFYSSYDDEIVDDISILNIPVLSIVLPVAWITGADVHVDELDKAFAESMRALQQEYKKMYPRAPFNTKLMANSCVVNNNTGDGTALLFSGGLDSTYTLFSNMALNPRLIMLFGIWDIPISNTTLQDRIRGEYSNFAKREGVELNFVRTNALEVLNIGRLEHFFWRFEFGRARGYWNGLAHSLGHIGQVAPLSIGRFSRIFVAASAGLPLGENITRANPYASYPSTDEKIGWANIRVHHHGCIHRHEKVFALEKYLNQNRIRLRVCGESQELLKKDSINCCRCEKCLRTIASLTLAGIDPNICGFDVDDSTFHLMKTFIEQQKINQRQIINHWKPLQRIIPMNLKGDLYGSKQFFEWFKKVDLDSAAKPFNKAISILYFKCPYPISKTLRRIFHQSRGPYM